MMSDYPYGMTLRPIKHWPGPLTTERRVSQFSAPWRSTLNALDRELFHLGKGNRNAPAILQIAMREQDFRLDGMPRANAKPEHPGVILTIETAKQGTLNFPCDRFTTWQDNLRAITLGLEALRKVERYGITPNSEQYTGWRQLPESGAEPTMSVDKAEQVIRDWADLWSGEASITLDVAYKRARRNAHPDRNSGDQSGWDTVESAADLLRAAGRL